MKTVKVCMFTCGYTNFTNNLEKVFPGMSAYYNLNEQPLLIFANMVQLHVKAGGVGNKKPNKDVTY